MKKGFTLIELLAVIAILAVISVITFPVVNNLIKGANQHAYDENIEVIKKAAYDWTLLNTSLLPENENESIIVYLGELKLSGSIDKNIKNPLTGKFLSNNTAVVVTKSGNEYVYEVNVVDLNGNNNDKTPLLVISGNIVDYVEVTQENVTYTVPSATAKTGDGYPISSSYISYQIFKDDIEVGSVDVSSLGMYTIKYSVTYDGETGIYEKKVVVRDTTKPVLTIGENIFCEVDDLPDEESLLNGITVTDNSGETITPTYRSEVENRPGVFYVYYTAKDSSNNEVTKRKEVNVYDNSSSEHSVLLGTNWTFDYNGTDGIDGSVQTFTVPENGKYKLEVWGAQGGGQTSSGGYGGYSVGEITLRRNNLLYITVGGTTTTSAGGYNGGGTGNTTPSQMSAGGGGATHIATATGELSTLAGNKQSVIIVAGGGGGEYYYFPNNFNSVGGHAGGYVGNNGNVSFMSCFNSVDTPATGGNQSTGGYGNNNNETYMGAFGQGGSAEEAGAGGGGGYYGGGGTYNVGCSAEGAAGGSGYIANSSLSNKKMVCYDCTEDKVNAETYTEKTTCANETSQENCAKKGNGYAKITLISY